MASNTDIIRLRVDGRIDTLIANGVRLRHRSMFVLVGDKSLNQIVNLDNMRTQHVKKSRSPLLWCYKDKLEISSHKKKRVKQVQKLVRQGLLDRERADPFSLFLENRDITYCLYRDSDRVLGNTFGMCILQDFEALTPNILARTIETVEGGGLIVLLLRTLTSLTSLYAMVMDVHERFRTESHSISAPRFNERFLLSIASCKACVVVDDELNVLPLSSHIRTIEPVSVKEDSEGLSEKERELKDLKEQFREDFPVGPLIGKCCTMDQSKAVVYFLDSILDKTVKGTIALLAARGRGKSAALGLAIAGAIAAGYSNIYVTAPSPENLKTFFEFVCKGINALDYKEHVHYDVVKSTDPELKKATTQINIYKHNSQCIQYLKPNDHGKLSRVELLVIDEAAAIPLPIVKAMLGPYMVFMSSTVNGYEGTGRSLSLKLLQQLESAGNTGSGKHFRKIELNESIRYASGDPIEVWLNGLLCLDVANSIPKISRLPYPKDCDLYYVNRDTLFSYHKESEIFLQGMMALYVASHYKNSPNDLQLMADAPAHHLFVLLGPVDESKNHLPDILCVIQVCLEGQISKKSALKSLKEGRSPHGDQIPWKFCEQFQDEVFPSLSGVRIVRIAVHPSAQRLGYGSAAVDLLTRYYEGQMTPFIEDEEIVEPNVTVLEAVQKVSLLTENPKPRAKLPPLLVPLRERRPEKLHYMGVSFGLTHDLFRFWRKHKFYPFYVSQIASALTGEHTCMVLKPINSDDKETYEGSQCGFLEPFYQDFRNRFRELLDSAFCSLDYKLAMSILASKIDFTEPGEKNSIKLHLKELLSPYDMKRLESYANNMVDLRLISDLVPRIAHQYFRGNIPVTLSPVQAAVFFSLGVQKKDIGAVKEEMGLEREHVLSNFLKVMKKLYSYFHSVAVQEVDIKLPQRLTIGPQLESGPSSKSLDEVLDEAAHEVTDKWKSEAAENGVDAEADPADKRAQIKAKRKGASFEKKSKGKKRKDGV